MFVLLLFGKFMLLYPMLMGCRRFDSIQSVAPWTPRTSNTSNVLSAVLKMGVGRLQWPAGTCGICQRVFAEAD